MLIDDWMREIKANSPPEELGMIMVRNGIVRATSKTGEPIRGMLVQHDEAALDSIVEKYAKKQGIAGVKVRINSGNLKIGDDIMLVLVAGRFRTDVLPVLEALMSEIKTGVVREEELSGRAVS